MGRGNFIGHTSADFDSSLLPWHLLRACSIAGARSVWRVAILVRVLISPLPREPGAGWRREQGQELRLSG